MLSTLATKSLNRHHPKQIYYSWLPHYSTLKLIYVYIIHFIPYNCHCCCKQGSHISSLNQINHHLSWRIKVTFSISSEQQKETEFAKRLRAGSKSKSKCFIHREYHLMLSASGGVRRIYISWSFNTKRFRWCVSDTWSICTQYLCNAHEKRAHIAICSYTMCIKHASRYKLCSLKKAKLSSVSTDI